MQHRDSPNTTAPENALHRPLSWKQFWGLAVVTIALPLAIIITIEGVLS